jgi:TP901 family phage tail tape measure protein
MAGAESFTILAILEARDRASEIFAKIDESLGKFSSTAKSAADTAKGAGDSIDDSLLQTASGADALDLASARVAAAQAKLSQATDELVNSERGLLEAQQATADVMGDGVAEATALAEADVRLASAQKGAAAAAKALSDAQKVQSDTAVAAAAKNDEAAAGQDAAAGASDKTAVSLAGVGRVAGITAAGLGIVGAVAIKTAGNFQSLTQHLVTDAGESQKKLAMVRAGILSISTATGTSASDITNAMYHIESAGMHGAEGLKIAQVAAEGAKIGGADLDTVSKTLAGTMVSYYGKTTNASNATQRATSVMEQLVATVGSGDMRMQDLASSLSNVAPFAAKAGISLAQVGGAIATMTSQNMTAQQATQDLGHMITSLQNPTSVQTNEMAQLGLNSLTVSKNLGKEGLTGTIATLTGAITKHMGPSGTVIMNAFNQSTAAAQDANLMLSKLPASIQGVARAYLAGTTSYQTFYTATKSVGLQARTLADQFAATAGKAHGFNSLLTSGLPAAQTYQAALAKMTGGQTSLKVALMLTGQNAGIFSSNVANIAKQGQGAAALTKSWAEIQAILNQKFDVAKAAVENAGTAIGTALLPAATRLMSVIAGVATVVAGWTAKHQKLTEYLFASVAGLAALVAAISLATRAFKAVSNAVSSVRSVISGVIGLFKKLGGQSKQTADQQAADAKRAAAANEKASADSAAAAETSAGEQEAASGEAAAAAETDAAETAAANETAAAESSGSWIAAAGQQIASAAGWVVESAGKVAFVVASNVAGAATTAGSWVAAGAQQVAAGAVWVAQGIGKVAVMVAANVAGAVTTAAAWVVANAAMLLGIGLVVALVVAAVVLIVKNWGKISAGAKAAFHDVLSVVDSTISWVKGHWPLLLAILTGPIGLATLFIVKHWDQIKDGASDLLGDLIRFFTGLPGKIWSALGDLGRMMFNAGKSAISMLISGLKSIPVIGTMVSIAGDIADHFPHSPAKRGPLSGSGSPDVAGRNIPRMLAQGIAAGTPQATAAALAMAARVQAATSSLTARSGSAGIGSPLALSAIGPASGGGGGGGTTIVIDVHDNHIMSDSDISKLTQRIGRELATKVLPQAGQKIHF